MEVPANSDENDKSKKKHLCSTCGSAFAKRSDVIRHERTHTGERPFTCEVCGTRFSQTSSLKIHLRKHTGERPFKCQYCDRTFGHSHRLKSHLVKFHRHTHYHCNICGLEFDCHSDLERHINFHQITTCEENVNDKGGYRANIGCLDQQGENGHIQRSIPHGERCVSAEPRSAISNAARFSRMKTTDKRIKLPSQYSQADLRPKLLKSQLKSGSASLMCEMCGSFYPDTTSLECHRQNMHDDNEKPVEYYNYSSRDLKVEHTSNLNKRKTVHSKEKTFKCKICDSSFSLSGNLKIHMRTHTGEKPFTCEICGMRFAHSQAQKAHYRVHSYSNKMHVCEFCGVSYSSKKSFNHHLLRRSHYHECNNTDTPVSQCFSTQVYFKQKRIENKNGQLMDIEKTSVDATEEEENTGDQSKAPSCDYPSPSMPSLNEADSFPTFQDQYFSETETEVISSLKSDECAEYSPNVNTINSINQNILFSLSPGIQMTWKRAGNPEFVNDNSPQLKLNDSIETNSQPVAIHYNYSPGLPAFIERGVENERTGGDFYPHAEEGRNMEAKDTRKIPSIHYNYKQSVQSKQNIKSPNVLGSHKSCPNIILDTSLQGPDEFHVLGGRSFDPYYIGTSPQPESVNSSGSCIPNAVQESVEAISCYQSSPLTSSNVLSAFKGDIPVSESSINSVVKILSDTSVSTEDVSVRDMKNEKREYSIDVSQSIEKNAVSDENGQNTFSDSEERNKIENWEKSPTGDEALTLVLVDEIIAHSSGDVNGVSSTSSNFSSYHGKGPKEGDGSLTERKDTVGESVSTTQNQWEHREMEKVSLEKREMEREMAQEMETQMKCIDCPLGLFDASVISVLCQDECFGVMLERNSGTQKYNSETSSDATLRNTLGSLSTTDLANEEASRTEKEHYNSEERDGTNELSDKDLESNSSLTLPEKQWETKITLVATNILEKQSLSSSSSPPMFHEFASMVDQYSSPVSEWVKSVPSLSQLASKELNSTNRKQTLDHPAASTPIKELASPFSESQLCFNVEGQGINLFTSKDVGFRRQGLTTVHEEQEANKIIVAKSNEGTDEKCSSMQFQTGDGIIRRWTVSEYKHNYRISTLTQKTDDEYKQLQTKDKSFACNQCNASFYRIVRLRQHQRIHSLSKKRCRECQICHTSFIFKNTLQSDIKFGAEQKSMSFKLLEISSAKTNESSECPLVDTSFSRVNDSNLSSDHSSQTISRDKQKLYLCQVCGESSFSSSRLFNLHIRRHGRVASHNCDVCSTAFSKKSNLLKHKLIHSGEQPYKCDICFKRFTQRANLQVHMRIHTGEQPFSCKECSASFAHSQAFKLHMRFHAKETKFVCHTCGKGFVVKAALEKHCLSHTGETPFVCSVCDTRLSSKSSLSRHAKRHKLSQGLLPYSCAVCSTQFAQSGHLKLHQKSNSRCQSVVGD